MCSTSRGLLILIASMSLVGGCNGNGPGDECVPETCESLELDCDVHDDGCGGELDCGECEVGYECEKGVCIPGCLPEPCDPHTCESLGVRCGTHDDGCGDIMDCGPCGSCPGDPLCFAPEDGEPDALVEVVGGQPPALAGGPTEDAWYELESLRFFTEGFLASGFATGITITSNGNSYGSVEFWNEQWGFSSQMDLHIRIELLMGDPVSQNFLGHIDLGGCYEAAGNRITGDILECGGQWLDGSQPPDGFDYETGDGEVRLLVVIEKEVFINSLPPEYQDYGGMIFAGDLPILMTFVE